MRAQRPFPMAFLAAASQRGLPLVLLSPVAYWGFDEALEVRQVSHRHRLDCRRRTSARSVVLELTDGGQGLLVVAVMEYRPVGGPAHQAQELSSGSDHRHFEQREPGAQVCVACRRGKVGVGKMSENWRSF